MRREPERGVRVLGRLARCFEQIGLRALGVAERERSARREHAQADVLRPLDGSPWRTARARASGRRAPARGAREHVPVELTLDRIDLLSASSMRPSSISSSDPKKRSSSSGVGESEIAFSTASRAPVRSPPRRRSVATWRQLVASSPSAAHPSVSSFAWSRRSAATSSSEQRFAQPRANPGCPRRAPRRISISSSRRSSSCRKPRQHGHHLGVVRGSPRYTPCVRDGTIGRLARRDRSEPGPGARPPTCGCSAGASSSSSRYSSPPRRGARTPRARRHARSDRCGCPAPSRPGARRIPGRPRHRGARRPSRAQHQRGLVLRFALEHAIRGTQRLGVVPVCESVDASTMPAGTANSSASAALRSGNIASVARPDGDHGEAEAEAQLGVLGMEARQLRELVDGLRRLALVLQRAQLAELLLEVAATRARDAPPGESAPQDSG